MQLFDSCVLGSLGLNALLGRNVPPESETTITGYTSAPWQRPNAYKTPVGMRKRGQKGEVRLIDGNIRLGTCLANNA